MREGDMHFSCGRAGTRRWVVWRPVRRVRVWTSERRMASFGLDWERVWAERTGVVSRANSVGKRTSRRMVAVWCFGV